ncbi:MAG: ATP-binding protein [Gemmataceae bacterium]|nr:ATP-binding protein [Gemmata sp.]MDW8199558.1 ATP-binding protein [Gemmataceae bacterium]
MTPLSNCSADYQLLVQEAAAAAHLCEPVAFTPGGYLYTLLTNATPGPLSPIRGTLVRLWTTRSKFYPNTTFGIRQYTLEGIRFARCVANGDPSYDHNGYDIFVVARADYVKLFRHVLKLSRKNNLTGLPPVLPEDQLEVLRQNTLGYLERNNLKRIKKLGGRPKRGLLLTGPPGNGKTSACRWLWEECQRHGYEYQIVSPDAYQAARRSDNPVQAVRDLFTVNRCGIIFFDDMDVALRDRETIRETDDQAVFLSALDGIQVNEGVVYVFTTNCSLELIDPAFKRPGRIDLVLHFALPDAQLRRRLMDRWHNDIKAGINLDVAVAQTAGYSFAEVEELKNLLILRYLDTHRWEWDWAMEQFSQNRADLAKQQRHLGFANLVGVGCNGTRND